MFPPIFGTTDWPRKVTAAHREERKIPAERFTKFWREYLTDRAKRMYPTEYTSGAFLDALLSCSYDATVWADDMQLYPILFPQWLGMQHTNLQSDNAYFWRTDEGVMDCGIIDWGGCGPKYFSSTLTAALTSARGEVLHEHEEGFLRCFRDEFYRESGIFIDFGEFLRQWHLSYCTYIQSMGSNIEAEVFREVKKEEWADICSLDDPKISGRWNTRCYAFMILHALDFLYLRWKDKKNKKYLHVHDQLREWKAFWLEHDMV